MNELLKPSLRKFVVVFFYDILVYNSSLSQHVHQLEEVLSILTKGSFFLRQSKCLFACQTLLYLDHIISSKGVEPEQSKIKVMLDWPVPSNQKDLRRFLGLPCIYRKFIKGYASIASPLNSLLCKDTFL